MGWPREVGCNQIEAGPVEQSFENPSVGRELHTDVAFEILPAKTLAIDVAEFVDHLLEVLGVLGRREGKDDVPYVEQSTWFDVAGDVNEGGLLPKVGKLVERRFNSDHVRRCSRVPVGQESRVVESGRSRRGDSHLRRHWIALTSSLVELLT